MKWALFVDIEVWNGCSSMKWVLFVDVEVRSGCSDGPSPRPPCPQVLQWHPCKPRRLESQDNARDKGGGNDCVRCVGSGFDLALRDGVRIFERWSSNIGRAIAWFIGGATGQNHRQRSGSLFRNSLPADRLNIFIQQSQQSQQAKPANPAKPHSKASKAAQLSHQT